MKVERIGARLFPILVLLLALIFVGCGTEEGTTTSVTGTVGDTTSGMLAPPGLYELQDGTVQALGILTYRDLEGGFWAVVETTLPDEADAAAIVALVGPSEDMEASLDSYRGEFVSVIGVEQDVSAYQAGPFIEATSIKIVEEMKVE